MVHKLLGPRPPPPSGSADARSSADACLSWQRAQGREANRRRHRPTEPTPKALCQSPPPPPLLSSDVPLRPPPPSAPRSALPRAALPCPQRMRGRPRPPRRGPRSGPRGGPSSPRSSRSPRPPRPAAPSSPPSSRLRSTCTGRTRGSPPTPRTARRRSGGAAGHRRAPPRLRTARGRRGGPAPPGRARAVWVVARATCAGAGPVAAPRESPVGRPPCGSPAAAVARTATRYTARRRGRPPSFRRHRPVDGSPPPALCVRAVVLGMRYFSLGPPSREGRPEALGGRRAVNRQRLEGNRRRLPHVRHQPLTHSVDGAGASPVLTPSPLPPPPPPTPSKLHRHGNARA